MAFSSSSCIVQETFSYFSVPISLVGRYISVQTENDFRYGGICSCTKLNMKPPFVGLVYVRDFGTEGRRKDKDGIEFPPKDYLVDYIIFDANQIVDIRVPPVPGSLNMHPPSNDGSAQAYHRLLQDLLSRDLRSATLAIPISAPSQDANAGVIPPADKGKSLLVEPMPKEAPTDKGKSIMVEETWDTVLLTMSQNDEVQKGSRPEQGHPSGELPSVQTELAPTTKGKSILASGLAQTSGEQQEKDLSGTEEEDSDAILPACPFEECIQGSISQINDEPKKIVLEVTKEELAQQQAMDIGIWSGNFPPAPYDGNGVSHILSPGMKDEEGVGGCC